MSLVFPYLDRDDGILSLDGFNILWLGLRHHAPSGTEKEAPWPRIPVPGAPPPPSLGLVHVDTNPTIAVVFKNPTIAVVFKNPTIAVVFKLLFLPAVDIPRSQCLRTAYPGIPFRLPPHPAPKPGPEDQVRLGVGHGWTQVVSFSGGFRFLGQDTLLCKLSPFAQAACLGMSLTDL
ncbi:hypothetical protein LY76DRAFT_126292 [Colletotrichum caudatum]|nr:hypothetical protein LY76DRAFT_126292 [Colletotrichum caudatum]